MAGASSNGRMQLAAAGAALRALAFLTAALSLKGCSLITIAYCPGRRIEHGRVKGTWQHDAAVVECDDGYEYIGEQITCDESELSCSLRNGHKVCQSHVGLFPRSQSKGRQAAGKARSTGLACTREGAVIPPTGVDAWVHTFFQRWNAGNTSALAASLAPRPGEPAGEVSPELSSALLANSFEVEDVHVCSGSTAALVELLVTVNNGSNHTLNVTDFMEFDHDGLITAKSLAAITRTLQNVENGHGQASLEVSGLPPNGNDLYLYKVFAPFGAIQSVKAALNEDGTCTGVGAVVFADAADAHKARKKLDGHAPDTEESNEDAVLHVSVKIPGEGEEKTE